ncbi:MAG: phosphoenolpyruvate--protein phosphotransferase [Candidatus Cloacimonetes bacterium]|jgi:phosphotransferase system enzyme I (PtsI)|nr:phosphoenolpyruvate--protein phosphotransferase [Candidatus Cloacimonadota bacterium]MDY0336381.1 phosphoenolpyruvate--protein phosphotransferase [Candidatus Cloacimonadaceae bacterium]MCB5269662.1 phosphoenolpyruvate--protein phosphotransferase [Candidatus Cloacimonadota bacterium]MCK9333820.1 phosphoenolpyruvate--protein phosphotransferase [Candidatus Cloacimonadota bacterium]MDD2682872.1 phosphoenolpyruvate--protein phosphotransferase [Candidatus Cloacimonadota bacterium]
MQELFGLKVSAGLAVGLAYFVENRSQKIGLEKIPEKEISKELKRLQSALTECKEDLTDLLTTGITNESEREILTTHIDILNDPELIKNIQEAISHDLFSATKAVQDIFRATAAFFENLDSDMFRQRAADYQDVEHRLLSKLLGEEQDIFHELDSQHIPILTEIKPSQVSMLHRRGIRAMIIDSCSSNSHAAIISRSLSIAVVSAVTNIRTSVKKGSNLIVDADAGKVLVEPDEEMLEYYAQRLQVEELIRQKHERLKETECISQDGIRIGLHANIGLPEELANSQHLGWDGIGLFRTEYIYLSRNTLPSEEEQFEAYRDVVTSMAPKPVTIRTFDLGGDKLLHLIPSPQESNPYLGNRGIRFSLAHPELFKTQLRAIIRASAFGKVRVMFPMVIDVMDFLEARALFNTCVDELYSEGFDYDSAIAVGTMIEVPSAALCSDALAQECDFFSIGTNDLAQYTLAVDRNAENVSRYYISHHPAVLKLIQLTLINADKHKIPVSICGEMASQPEYVPLLIGMGITELSINVNTHFNVKTTVQNCDEKLHLIVKNFDFSTTLAQVDKLIYHTLKPYYSKQGRK